MRWAPSASLLWRDIKLGRHAGAVRSPIGRETIMLRQLVLAIFADEPSADAAADGLNRWAGQEAAAKVLDTHQIQAMGVLVYGSGGPVGKDARVTSPIDGD
jgi:hypothetical protein